MKDGELPIEVLNGRPGYINFFGCIQQLAACKRAERGNRSSRSGFF